VHRPAVGRRTDRGGGDGRCEAKQKAEEANKLHAEGKHAEAEKAAKEGLAPIGK